MMDARRAKQCVAGRRTGPISSVTVMGQTIVIVNDARLAFELMEKRSAIHSSRPKQLFAGEMYVDAPHDDPGKWTRC